MRQGGRATSRLALLGSAVEAELAQERANVLGRAGRRLEIAVADYRTALALSGGTLPPQDEDALLDAIRELTYQLLVQRECLGFRSDTLAWVQRCYDVPAAVLRRL